MVKYTNLIGQLVPLLYARMAAAARDSNILPKISVEPQAQEHKTYRSFYPNATGKDDLQFLGKLLSRQRSLDI